MGTAHALARDPGHGRPALEVAHRRLAERARAGVGDRALHRPADERDEPIVFRASARKPKPDAITREHLRKPLAVDLEPVRVGDPEHEPHLVERQDRQVGARDEDGDAEERVLARELPDQLLADRPRAARAGGRRAASPARRASRARRCAISSTGKPAPRRRRARRSRRGRTGRAPARPPSPGRPRRSADPAPRGLASDSRSSSSSSGPASTWTSAGRALERPLLAHRARRPRRA